MSIKLSKKDIDFINSIDDTTKANWLFRYLCFSIKKKYLSDSFNKKDINKVLVYYGFHKNMRGILENNKYILADFKTYVRENKDGVLTYENTIALLDEIKSQRVDLNDVKNKSTSIILKENEPIKNKIFTENVLIPVYIFLTLLLSVFIAKTFSVNLILSVISSCVISLAILVLAYLNFRLGYKEADIGSEK